MDALAKEQARRWQLALGTDDSEQTLSTQYQRLSSALSALYAPQSKKKKTWWFGQLCTPTCSLAWRYSRVFSKFRSAIGSARRI